jgi:Flp pilus assembly protein TadG
LNLRRSQGSAVIEFVLLSVPLTLLSITVVATALMGFSKSVITDSIIEGARFAALADQSPQDGCDRASKLIFESIAKRVEVQLRCQTQEIQNSSYSLIEARVRLATISVFLPALEFVTETRAINEIQ